MKFDYKALSAQGAVLTGSVECSSRAEAISKVKADGLTLLDLSQGEESASADGDSKSALNSAMPTVEFRKIRPTQIAFLFRQLGELVDAGLPIVSAVDSLQKFCGNEKMKKLLTDVSSRIRSGGGFSEALAAQQGVFSRVQLALIQVGESSGTLDDVLRRTADMVEAQLELRGKIRSALAYPFFILAFSGLLCWGLVAFLLPTFEPIWKGANVDLTQYPVTEFLLQLSAFTKSPVDEVLLIGFLFMLGFVFKQLSATPEGQDFLGTTLLKLPLLGKYLQLSQTSEICSTLARLLESGLPLPEAIDLTAQTASNPVFANALSNAALGLRTGNDLTSTLEVSDTFPELFIQMVGVGETIGDLPNMLNRVGLYYKRQLDDSLKSLTALIEPLMMVLIGGIVFVFILGVFLPVMGIVNSLSGGAH